MNSESKKLPVAMLVTLALAVSLTLAQTNITCPPKNDPALEEIFYYSDIVAMGKAVAKHPVHNQDNNDQVDSDVYTVDMDVYCVYKGDSVQHKIHISETGMVAHRCLEADFEVGMVYMVYLREHSDGRLTPLYKPNTEDYKDEIVIMCDHKIELPDGLSELPKDVQCTTPPPEYDNDDDYYGEDVEKEPCFRFKPTDGAVPPYKTGQVGDTDVSDGGNDDNGNGVQPLRMSLLWLALLPLAILVFS